jgi:hypothetical protein
MITKLLQKVSINGRKHPRDAIKMITDHCSHLRAIHSYSDTQIMGNILQALGTDYNPLVITLDISNDANLTISRLKDQIFSYYAKHHTTFPSVNGTNVGAALHGVPPSSNFRNNPSASLEDRISALTRSVAAIESRPKGKGGKGGKGKNGGGGEKGNKGKQKKQREPPECTLCVDGTKHFFADCPVIKTARE